MLDRIEHGVAEQRRFVADASHELRTPLAVMRAELEVALRSDDPAAGAPEVLDSAAEEVARMSTIVEDLLTLAHRDENRLQLLLERLDLGEVAAKVATQLRPLAKKAGVQLTVDASSARVVADHTRITQVVTNLVDDAVKYAGPGASVQVRVWDTADGPGLAVTDTGPGIAPEHSPRCSTASTGWTRPGPEPAEAAGSAWRSARSWSRRTAGASRSEVFPAPGAPLP